MAKPTAAGKMIDGRRDVREVVYELLNAKTLMDVISIKEFYGAAAILKKIHDAPEEDFMNMDGSRWYVRPNLAENVQMARTTFAYFYNILEKAGITKSYRPGTVKFISINYQHPVLFLLGIGKNPEKEIATKKIVKKS